MPEVAAAITPLVAFSKPVVVAACNNLPVVPLNNAIWALTDDAGPLTSPAPIVVRMPAAVVAPVPPLAMGNGVPEYETANVPLVVMGEPETDKKAGTDMATDETEPPPPPPEGG